MNNIMIHSSASITASIVKVNPYIRTGSSLVKTNKSLHTTHHTPHNIFITYNGGLLFAPFLYKCTAL